MTGALASLTRSDGTLQVTYLGLPLYYWKGDTKAGDTTGEDVNGFLIANVSGPARPVSDRQARVLRGRSKGDSQGAVEPDGAGPVLVVAGRATSPRMRTAL